MMSIFFKRPTRALALACALAGVMPSHAGIDSIVTFNPPGKVDIYLTGNAGGFDHILEPLLVAGNAPFVAAVLSGLARMVGTRNGSLLNLVGDPNAPRTPTGFNCV